MRTVIHLSDIHFGKVNIATIAPLLATVAAAKPDIVVVSGDFTQRATKQQFIEAKKFLGSLPAVPQILVPGNHDQPLFNLFARMRDPLKKYRHFINREIEPGYIDEEVAIFGINTTRGYRITDGKISDHQINVMENRLAGAPKETIKIIVSHHPFDMPEGFPAHRLVRKAPLAMPMFAKNGVDVFLAGHFHKKYVGSTAHRYKIENHGALVVQSGTSASIRTRNEEPSFNLLKIKGMNISVSHYVWNPANSTFILSDEETFTRKKEGWKSVDK